MSRSWSRIAIRIQTLSFPPLLPCNNNATSNSETTILLPDQPCTSPQYQLAHSSFLGFLQDFAVSYQMHLLPLASLVSADIKVKEPSLEGMARGKIVYEPPNFMTVNTALEQLLEVEQQRQEKGKACPVSANQAVDLVVVPRARRALLRLLRLCVVFCIPSGVLAPSSA